MSSPILTLVRHSMVYGLGSALSVAGGFILIPLYTRILSTSEYGLLEMINRIADVMILVFFLGCRQAYTRLYYDQSDEQGRQLVTGTMILFSLATSLFALSIALPFIGMTGDLLLENVASRNILYLVLLWIPLEMIVNIGLGFLTARMLPGLFVGINGLRLLGYISLNVWLLYGLGWGITGILSAQLIVTGTIAVGFMIYFISWTRLRASIHILRQLLILGLPYLPTAFFMYLISSSDRFFLQASASLEEVGLYALSYKIGFSLTMMFLEPILRAWPPFMYARYQDSDGPILLGRVLTLFTLTAVTVGLTIAIAAPLLIPIIAGEQYQSAWHYVPLLTVAGVFYGVAHLVDAGILIGKKTGHKPVIFGVTAAITLACNYLLIPRIGIAGAALAAIVAYGVMIFMTNRYACRYYRMELEHRRLVLIGICAAVSYVFALLVLRFCPWGRTGPLLSLSALIAFPLLLWGTGFFTLQEKHLLIGMIMRRKS